MKRIPPKRKLPKCNDNPEGTGKHDFETERQDRKVFKTLGKRERWLWKHGWRRCWFCGTWDDYKQRLKDQAFRKKLIKRWGLEKFKKRERRYRRKHGFSA